MSEAATVKDVRGLYISQGPEALLESLRNLEPFQPDTLPQDDLPAQEAFPITRAGDMAGVSDETFDTLWAYCTTNNRLVPMPTQWNQLYGMLKNTHQKPSGGWEPPLPLILAAWHHSMPIEKHLRFQDHVRWAEAQKQLPEIAAFLRSLPETQWCHFGET